jgi:glyoxylase-like metal-dependent hydrolase (beta-lactamase superfamily II)
MSGAFTADLRDAVYGATESVPAVRLYTLDCGRLDIADMSLFSDTGEHTGERGTLAVPCFLIRHPKGNLLWDTGLGDRLAAKPEGVAGPLGSHLQVSVTLAAQLAKLGLKPADIQFVALSHLHADHAGNLQSFPAATWLINPAELKWAQGTPAPLGVDPGLLSGHAKEKTVSIEQDHDVFGDGSVRILKMPGHTPGHQVLWVRLARSGSVVLSGDLFHTRENFEKSLVPPGNTSRAETLASFDRLTRLLRNTGARLVVQHDARDFKALPAPPAFLE